MREARAAARAGVEPAAPREPVAVVARTAVRGAVRMPAKTPYPERALPTLSRLAPTLII